MAAGGGWSTGRPRRAPTRSTRCASFSELSQRLPDNAIVAAGSGSAANWYARVLRFTGKMRGSLSGTLATMGPGVPYVIGAKWAHPDRPAIALVGDGAMQTNGLAELITIAHHWTQWTDPAWSSPCCTTTTQPAGLGARRGLRGVRARPRSACTRHRQARRPRRRLGSGVERRPCSTCAAIRTSRRFRRTGWHRCVRWRVRCCTVTRTPGDSSSRASNRRHRSSSPAATTTRDRARRGPPARVDGAGAPGSHCHPSDDNAKVS